MELQDPTISGRKKTPIEDSKTPFGRLGGREALNGRWIE